MARRLEYGDSERLDDRARFLGREEDGREDGREEDDDAEALGFEVRGLEVTYFSDLSEGRAAGLEAMCFGVDEATGLAAVDGFFEKDGIGGVPVASRNDH